MPISTLYLPIPASVNVTLCSFLLRSRKADPAWDERHSCGRVDSSQNSRSLPIGVGWCVQNKYASEAMESTHEAWALDWLEQPGLTVTRMANTNRVPVSS